jgi:hypothetical protein
MTDADPCRLLHGPYVSPPLRRGDIVECLARDCDVKVTSWTNARISWPRCQILGQRGGSGILVEAELARAVRCESALAIRYWWGVIDKTVAWWRRALGVERMDSEGSRRLILAGIEAKAAKARGRPLPPEQVERRRQTAIELDLGRNLRPRPGGRPWTAEELGDLGTAPDAELAQRFGRTEQAIRIQRDRLGIDRAPGDNARRPWEAWEDALVLQLPVKDAAVQTARTRTAVYQRRLALGTLPPK